MPYWRNETALVDDIWKKVHKKYPLAWIFKVHGGPMQMQGVPDLIIIVDGLFIGAEVKHQKPGESEAHARDRATPGQRIQIYKILQAGGIAGVVLTPEETLQLIEDGLTNNRAQWQAKADAWFTGADEGES
jgi:hypothetical protein